MNILEYEMIEILKNLKNDFGVFQIKAEYENEGSRDTELMRLKDVAEKVDLPIILKVGGVEAITDIYNALALGVNGIIAPMAETGFAVNKFLNAIKIFIPDDNRKDIEFAINIETITAYNNLDTMLLLNDINILSSLTIGRVDFSASLGADRSFCNSDEMFAYCKNIFNKARQRGLKTALGGAISLESKSFVLKCINERLIDKFETRKLVYKNINENLYDDALKLGIKFELCWLKSKRRYYQRIKDEDEKRILMLEKRVKD